MSRFEMVANDIWQDEPFCDLTTAGKLVYLWSFLNPACGMSGVYKARPELVALDTGLSPEDVAAALQELDDVDLLRSERGVLWVRARVKHLKAGGPTLAKSIARDVAALPVAHPIRVAFLDAYAGFAWLRDELRPLVREGADEGPDGGHEGATESPVVEGNPDAPSGPPAGGPMHLHVHGRRSRRDENARRAREAEDDVWTHYLDTFYPDRSGNLPKFDDTRRKIVAAALAVRDAEQCKVAITGLSRSPHHNGQNDQGTRYIDIRYALRGIGGRGETHEERIDRMAALVTASPRRLSAHPNLTAAELVAAEGERP